MNRMNPHDVVNAYKATGLIPIRRAWTTTDARGACAFDAYARSCTDMTGDQFSSYYYDADYVKGFVEAWDAEDPMDLLDQEERCTVYLTGFWDAVACRDLVVQEFESITAVETSQ